MMPACKELCVGEAAGEFSPNVTDIFCQSGDARRRTWRRRASGDVDKARAADEPARRP